MSVKGVWAMSRTLQKWRDNRCYKLHKDRGLLWADSWETVWETLGSKLLSAVTGGNATSPQLTSPASVNERAVISGCLKARRLIIHHLFFVCFFFFGFTPFLVNSSLLLKTSGVFIQLNSPLSGSGVVQFLFSLCLSSLWACARSGLDALSALLFMALCSSLRIRPRDRLMKSGLKSSKASWCERGEVGAERGVKWAAYFLNKYSATYRHLRRGERWEGGGESVHSVFYSIYLFWKHSWSVH